MHSKQDTMSLEVTSRLLSTYAEIFPNCRVVSVLLTCFCELLLKYSSLAL